MFANCTIFAMYRWPAYGLILAVAPLSLCGCAGPQGITLWPAKQSVELDGGKQTAEEVAWARRDSSMERALARWRHGDKLGCERALIRALQIDPEFDDARLMLADVYTATERVDQAELQLQRVLKNEPNNASAHHSLGLILESLGREDESLVHMKRAAVLDPEMVIASQQTTSQQTTSQQTTSQQTTSQQATKEAAKKEQEAKKLPTTYAVANAVNETSIRRGNRLKKVVVPNPPESSSQVVQVSFSDAVSPSYPRTDLADEPVVSNLGPHEFAESGGSEPVSSGDDSGDVRRLPTAPR